MPPVDCVFLMSLSTTTQDSDNYEVCYSKNIDDYLSCYLERYKSKDVEFFMMQVIWNKSNDSITLYTREGRVGGKSS